MGDNLVVKDFKDFSNDLVDNDNGLVAVVVVVVVVVEVKVGEEVLVVVRVAVVVEEEAVEEKAVKEACQEVLKNFIEEEDQWNTWNKSYIKLF